MTETAVVAVEQRIRERHEAELAEALRHREAAEAESASAYVAWAEAFEAWSASDTAVTSRRVDAAFNRAMSACAGRLSAQRRVADLSDGYATERRVEREREREVARRERAEREQAERRDAPPKKKGSATLVVVERGARNYPGVEDTGDGLAPLGRDALRELCKANGLSVGGHKATVVARLREAGVTA